MMVDTAQCIHIEPYGPSMDTVSTMGLSLRIPNLSTWNLELNLCDEPSAMERIQPFRDDLFPRFACLMAAVG
jgi:hypothetical protein